MASAALTGTILTFSPAREAQIVAGGRTLIITLDADTFIAAGATFNAQRQAILNGITSAQAEATGWNTVVRDAQAVTAVARTSDTVVTVTFAAAPTYDITANETITVTVPAAALTGGVALEATPTITIAKDTPGYESVNVDDTAGGVSLSPKCFTYRSSNYAQQYPAVRAVLTCETAAVRYTTNAGATLTATTNGIPVAVAGTIVLVGEDELRDFRAIRTTGSSGVLHARYYF